MDCSTLGFPVHLSSSQSLLKLLSTELVMPSNHLILCRPLLLPTSIFPSIRVFSSPVLVGTIHVILHQLSKYSEPHLSVSLRTSTTHAQPINHGVPWTSRRSNQLTLKEINSEYSLEGLMLKQKFQYFGQLMLRADPLEKTLMLVEIEGRRRRG